ncbi:MAG TPA: hypothetical protein VFJ84_03610 [Candidatus Saccharimonadales bacterium]|nr:hypothetical protein [Candidatus Saccharimonadales bacterium]
MKERLTQYGATLTASLALSGLATACAEARPAQTTDQAAKVTHVEKNRDIISVPPGVKATVSAEAQMHQLQEFVKHLHKRLDGVLVLHAPTKNAYVSFATSPLSYNNESPDFFVSRKTTEQKIISPNPAIGMFHGREYAAALDAQTGRWAILDIKFAQDMGALDIYSFKGKKLKIEDYPLAEQQADMPVIYDPTHYGADWLFKDKNTRDDVLQDIWLPTNIDPGAKKYSVVPSHKFPHL